MSNKICLSISGKSYEYDQGLTLEQISKDFAEQYKHDIILARIDGKLSELGKHVLNDAKIEFLTTATVPGFNAYKRTATMIMLKAFEDVFSKDEGWKLTVKYSLGNGYYCELEGIRDISISLLEKVESRMKEIVDANMIVYKKSMAVDDAIEIFDAHKMYDKVHLLQFRRSSQINIYEIENTVAYYYGYMAPHTGMIRYFKLYKYDEGFVLQFPQADYPDQLKAFSPPEKLFAILKQSAAWGELMGIRTVADMNQMIADGRFFELVLVQEALQEKKIAEIAAAIKSTGKRIILIAGPSSSGKTSFSHRLSIQLRAIGLKPHPIPVDNYFVDREYSPKDEQGKYNFESLQAIDLEGFNKDMQALLDGERVELPVYNFVTGHREYNGHYLQIGAHDVLVIEGIHALNDEMTYTLSKDFKFKIYVSALTQIRIDEHNRIPTTDTRLLRRIVRDAAKRGTSAAKTIEMWPSVRRGEEENIFPFQEDSDVMFNSAMIYELAVLKQYAEPHLFSVSKDDPAYEESKRLLKFLNYFLGVESTNIPNNSILREFIGGSCFPVG